MKGIKKAHDGNIALSVKNYDRESLCISLQTETMKLCLMLPGLLTVGTHKCIAI